MRLGSVSGPMPPPVLAVDYIMWRVDARRDPPALIDPIAAEKRKRAQVEDEDTCRLYIDGFVNPCDFLPRCGPF